MRGLDTPDLAPSVLSLLAPAYRNASWTPALLPIPSAHPAGRNCSWGQLRVGQLHQGLCLVGRDDFLSARIISHGRWDECDDIVELWHNRSGAGDVFLDGGANIGACTLQLLLRTSATVVAVEPASTNLFYLTRSLARVMQRHGWRVASRVAVVPFAVGAQPAQGRMRPLEQHNAGNMALEVGSATAAAAGADAVDVRRLDDLFGLEGGARVRVAKLDVQGCECLALSGGARLFAQVARQGGAVIAEASEKHLRAQGCSGEALRERLRALGFAVELREEGPHRPYKDRMLVGRGGG